MFLFALGGVTLFGGQVSVSMGLIRGYRGLVGLGSSLNTKGPVCGYGTLLGPLVPLGGVLTFIANPICGAVFKQKYEAEYERMMGEGDPRKAELMPTSRFSVSLSPMVERDARGLRLTGRF